MVFREVRFRVRMGVVTGLVRGLGVLVRGVGVKGFGVGRRSTGLVGGLVFIDFGYVFGVGGFCGK